MLSDLKKKILYWLGIDVDRTRIDDLGRQIGQLRHEFSEQMNMVGVDVGLKHDQTVIIFVSRLGRDGGTVRIVPAYFASVSQLMDFIQYTDRSFDPKKVAIDAPYGMGRLIEEERRRRR